MEVNENLTMINTLYMDKNGKFQRKKAVLTIQAIVEDKGRKKVGKVTFDISQYREKNLNEQIFSLEDCPDKKAKICLSISAQPLGEAMTADNMSEASGFSGISMGTEGDYQGPLFEQDLTGFEEEARAPKIIPGSHGKPPLIRAGKPNLPDMGAINPVKISEAMSRQSQPDIRELQAQVQVLEKENSSLRSEKDELKEQNSLLYSNSKKERENYYEHSKKLNEELDSFKKQNEKLKERVQRRDEKLEKMKSTNQSLLNDLKEMEKNNTNFSNNKEKFKEETQQLRNELRAAEEKALKYEKQLEKAQEQVSSLEHNVSSLQNQNTDLKQNMNELREELEESRNILTSRDTESDIELSRYKKKTEILIGDYKKRIKDAENEKEEALSKQTELVYELQKSKSEVSEVEEKLKNQVSRLETELRDLREDNSDLIQRLEEEVQARRNSERKTSMEKGDFDSRYNKLQSSYQELKARNQELQSTIADLEFRFHQSQEVSYDQMQTQTKIEKLEGTVNRLREEIRKKDQEIEEVYQTKETYESENSTLKDQLKKATSTEFSDPANYILQEQLEGMEEKTRSLEAAFGRERANLQERIEILEKELEILERKKRDLANSYEEQITKLQQENKLVRERSSEENKGQSHNLIQIEVEETKSKLGKLQEDYKNLEKKYVDAKMGWANADIEKENLTAKYRDAQLQLRDYSSEYTMMEVELYKINERLGQTLNFNIELENEIQQLKNELNAAFSKKKRK